MRLFFSGGGVGVADGCDEADGGGLGGLDQPAAGGGEHNHQGLENKVVEPEFGLEVEGDVSCRERLGGLLRYYYRDAA